MQYEHAITVDRTVLLNCRSKGDKLGLCMEAVTVIIVIEESS